MGHSSTSTKSALTVLMKYKKKKLLIGTGLLLIKTDS